MRVTHADKQAVTVRVNQSLEARKAAGDRFRQRYTDTQLKRALVAVLKDFENAENEPTAV